MTFEFKQKSQDFYVSENLPFQLSGEGEAFFVQISKRNMTTHDIIDHLHKDLGITRMSLGIAGLKDKKAIAKQWISIYDRALNKAGGEKVFLASLAQVCKVVSTWRHHTPMNMSTPITNTFHITFKATKNLGQEEREKAKEIVDGYLQEWYPNLFGSQRFGINGRNSTQGYEIMAGKSKEKFNKSDTIFKLQAYSSMIFNEWVKKRTSQSEAWMTLMEGDLLSRTDAGQVQYGQWNTDNTVTLADLWNRTDFFFTPELWSKKIPYDAKLMSITCPVPGFNTAIASKGTDAGKREQAFLDRHHLEKKTMKVFKEQKVYGLRRSIRVKPTNTKSQYNGDDLLIDFTLPSGSYASIVFDKLTEILE